MKKIKLIVVLFVCALILSGCFKMDSLENIDIACTNYPTTYITKTLYGERSKVFNIYSDILNTSNYVLTDKQINDYSKSGIIIFNGLLQQDNETITKMIKNNKKLKIIDSSRYMDIENTLEELWLDPSNFLMLTRNIKNGLDEYITNHYLKKEIETNYNQLKKDVSSLDSKYKLVAESANNKEILVSKGYLNFLTKYNINVINLNDNNIQVDKLESIVIDKIKNNEIKYLYMLKDEEQTELIKSIIAKTNVKVLYLSPLTSISNEDKINKKDYLSIMDDNLELIKEELFKL